MKNIYLTEEQYINLVLRECTNYGRLNESVINLRNMSKLLFRGCRNFSDCARRIIYAVTIGAMTITMACSVIKMIPGEENEKQELIQQIEATTSEKENSMLNKHYATNFKISSDGIEHIKGYEKCKLEPYYATKSEKTRGIRTIGWGHKIVSTDPAWLKNAKSITQEQADALFEQDIKIYENELAKLFKKLPSNLQDVSLYPQGMIDACISIIYNSGMGNLKASPFFQTLMRCRIDKSTGKINEEDFYYVCSQIRKSCITQNGKVVQGLVDRRDKECLMAQQ